MSRRRTAISIAAGLLSVATPSPAQSVEETPVWRAQALISVCSSTNAGTDNDVRVMLNGSNSTWLNYARDDFERGSEFTYDLTLGEVRRFSDISRFRVSKTGTDGLCLRKLSLLLNDRVVFTRSYSGGRWLDGDNRVLSIPSTELRGATWNAYVIPTEGRLVFGNAELESRIESAVGDALRRPGSESVRWGDITGEAVQVSYATPSEARVDLDLKAIVNNWPDQTVDVDFKLRTSCMLGKPAVSVTTPVVDVEMGFLTSTTVTLLEWLQDVGVTEVAVAAIVHPFAAVVLAIGAAFADDVALPAGATPIAGSGIGLPSLPICPSSFRFEPGPVQGYLPRASLRFEFSAAQKALLAGTMYCAPPPAADASAPIPSLIVEYRKPTGGWERRTVTSGANVTISADKNADIGITYIGQDPQGMRKVSLEYDMWYNSGNTRVQPLLVPISTSASCAQPSIIGLKRFSPDGTPWRYEFASRAENWRGGSAITTKVFVNTQ